VAIVHELLETALGVNPTFPNQHELSLLIDCEVDRYKIVDGKVLFDRSPAPIDFAD
jgi:hypothetical protein